MRKETECDGITRALWWSGGGLIVGGYRVGLGGSSACQVHQSPNVSHYVMGPPHASSGYKSRKSGTLPQIVKMAKTGKIQFFFFS